jgi:hypothetical protein
VDLISDKPTLLESETVTLGFLELEKFNELGLPKFNGNEQSVPDIVCYRLHFKTICVKFHR